MITQFAATIATPIKPVPGSKLYTGVDLRTAYIVLAVVDELGDPVAGAYQFANVVKEGLGVNLMEPAQNRPSLQLGTKNKQGEGFFKRN